MLLPFLAVFLFHPSRSAFLLVCSLSQASSASISLTLLPIRFHLVLSLLLFMYFLFLFCFQVPLAKVIDPSFFPLPLCRFASHTVHLIRVQRLPCRHAHIPALSLPHFLYMCICHSFVVSVLIYYSLSTSYSLSRTSTPLSFASLLSHSSLSRPSFEIFPVTLLNFVILLSVNAYAPNLLLPLQLLYLFSSFLSHFARPSPSDFPTFQKEPHLSSLVFSCLHCAEVSALTVRGAAQV